MTIDPNAIVLDERQRGELAAAASCAGKPWPAVLSEALAAYRPVPPPAGNGHVDWASRDGDGESFYAAAMRLGVVGCVRSGVPDLSTNPIHLEGFGGDDR